MAELQRSGTVAWRQVRVGALQGWIPDRAAVPVRVQPQSPSQPQPPGSAGAGVWARDGQLTSDRSLQAVTANAPGDAPLGQLRVNALQLGMRVAPDVNASMVLLLRRGQVVDALPQSPQGYWLPVQVDGRRGWAPAQWLVPLP